MPLLTASEPTTLFVPNRLGGYRAVVNPVSKGSIDNVIEHLGYNQDQVRVYFGDFGEHSGVSAVAFKIFTSEIAFVLAGESTNLKSGKVKFFLRDFNFKDFYNAYDVYDILSTGIKNRTLDIDYLSKCLKLKKPALGGIFYSDILQLHLHFTDGLLTNFQTSNGLELWGKYFQNINASLIASYEKEAKKYWGNDTRRIVQEVNNQADALASTPNIKDNAFAALHSNEDGLVNYCQLLICHYDHPQTEAEFTIINHGRYVRLPSETPGVNLYKCGLFTYKFDGDGKLLSTE